MLIDSLLIKNRNEDVFFVHQLFRSATIYTKFFFKINTVMKSRQRKAGGEKHLSYLALNPPLSYNIFLLCSGAKAC